jgi:hypothetical protein
MRTGSGPFSSLFLAVAMSAGWSAESWAQTTHPTVPVLLQNDAGAPADVVSNAKRETSRLFALIGVDITWVDQVPWPVGRLRVVSVTTWEPDDRRMATSVLGYTQTAPGQRGIRGYVFWRRVERASHTFTASLDKVLAIAIAHEIGHMLLPNGKHAKSGLMRAPWDANHFRSASAGLLTFSDDSATRIRQYAEAEHAVMSASRAATGQR